MAKDMNRQKYYAILDFFNVLAESLKLKHAKNFFDVYKSQLVAVIRILKLNDSFNGEISLETDPFKMAKEIFENSDSGIDFLAHLIPFNAEDQNVIGKLLIGILYHLKLIKSDLYMQTLQQIGSNQILEVQHTIIYVENKEQWPADGWPNVLYTPAPLDFYDRIQPMTTPHQSTSYIARTPLRRSMRISPYKRLAADSPIAKATKELTRKNQNLKDQINSLNKEYTLLGESHDELMEENKKYKHENQELKSLAQNAKDILHDYHAVNEELKKVKSEKESLQKDVHNLTENNRSLSDELKGCYNALEGYHSDIAEKEREVERFQNINASLNQQIADLNEEILEAQNDRDTLRKNFVDTEDALNRLRKDYDMMKKQNNEMSRMSLNVTDISNMNLADENQRLRDQITELTKKLEDERDQMNQQFEKRENVLNAEIERLNSKLTEVVRENEKRKAEIESCKTIINEKDAEILKYRSQNAELTGKFQGAKDSAEEWKMKYEAEHKRLTAIEEENENLAKNETALKAQVVDLAGQNQDLKNTAEEWKTKYEQEQQSLAVIQKEKDDLVKKEADLEETIFNQANDLAQFKRKQMGSLVQKIFFGDLSAKERISSTAAEDQPNFHLSKPIYREKQDFYFNLTCEYARPCYFTDWAHYRQGNGKYEPESYIPGICTHIFFAFAKINSDFTAAAFDPEDLADWNGNANGGYYAKVNALKDKQPGLKTVLSFGGWSAGTSLFKQMAAKSSNRQTFVQSAVAFIKQYNFDGIDIDWEYPEADDKSNYAAFMKELKEAAGSLLVTAAVTAAPEKVDIGYDVPALAQSLDFVNVMTYDFHGGWESFTGENSPLYAAPGDSSNWNTDYAMKYWAQQGMPKNKLLVGIAAYGRGWTLNDPTNHGIGAPGQAAPGLPITNTQGFAAYYEICNLGGTRYWDDNQKVPYIVKGNLWYGYDDVQSVGLKAQWIKDNGFGGAFVWTLDFDDFNGQCAGGKLYPILNTIKDVLGGGSPPTYAPPPTYPTTTTKSPPTGAQTQNPPTQNPNDPFKCPTDNGFFSDPKDCTRYYECYNGNALHLTCPPGTEWNEKIETCDWPSDTVCFQKKIQKSIKFRSVKV